MDFDAYTVFPRTKIGRDHQMRDQFRHGKVIERKMDEERGPMVRVQYLDKQGLISQWLPVKQFGSRATVHSYVPKIGDDVNVNMLPNGSEDGFIDGSFFNKNNPPPADVDIDTRHFKTEDGTIIEYREKDSTFRLDVGGAAAREGPKAGGGGGMIIIVGDIQHTGNMTTSGIHTDANGIHMGAQAREDLLARIEALEVAVREIKDDTKDADAMKLMVQNEGYAKALAEIKRILEKEKEKYPKEKIEEILDKPKPPEEEAWL